MDEFGQRFLGNVRAVLCNSKVAAIASLSTVVDREMVDLRVTFVPYVSGIVDVVGQYRNKGRYLQPQEISALFRKRYTPISGFLLLDVFELVAEVSNDESFTAIEYCNTLLVVGSGYVFAISTTENDPFASVIQTNQSHQNDRCYH